MSDAPSPGRTDDAAPDARSTGIDRLLEVMARLRDPAGGCPWDLEQSFATIAPYTIEEAYEVAEAIRLDDREALRDELGDLLLQVVFHAQMAREDGSFDFDTVARGIAEKMVRRHPNVFGDDDSDARSSARAQMRSWEAQKAAEREAKAVAEGRRPSVLDGVALALPALLRAEKLQKRAARVGFDWPDAEPVFDKVLEEVAELREAAAATDPSSAAANSTVAEEIGDLMFACVNLARHLGVEPESALRAANAKFTARFRHVEAALADSGRSARDVGLAELDRLWEEAKRAERRSLTDPATVNSPRGE
ncbi:MAG: nucleoside triphosphate pyrophosphohydrolase [Rhodospirillales bacterium]|nr:nucleoside triphosphate pyrophosphohydrolase [Rhodospirillales bacterium]MDE0379949.1 nucleoside triphosphate pyrophosphohydrolase [Rhodospirillales bacterium]